MLVSIFPANPAVYRNVDDFDAVLELLVKHDLTVKMARIMWVVPLVVWMRKQNYKTATAAVSALKIKPAHGESQ